MRETELKFAVHPSFVMPSVEGIAGVTHVERAEAQELDSTYYDASDVRLARSGVTLRYRTGEDEGPVWTLKLPTEDGPHTREEISFQGPATDIPTDAVSLLIAYLRSADLEPVATLHTTRVRWLLKDAEGQPLATVADDEVSMVDGDFTRARFREVEIESEGMELDRLHELGKLITDAGAMPAEPIPKIVRALGPRATAPPDVSPRPQPGADEPCADVVKAALSRGVSRLIAHDPGARLGDPHGVHQTRVAARRLRSDLRTFGPLVDEGWAEELTGELKWLADRLGEVRDLDVLQQSLSGTAEGLENDLKPLFHVLASRETHARERLMEALNSPRYRSLLDRLVDGSSYPPLTALASKPCREVLPGLVEKAWKALSSDAKKLGPLRPDEAWHSVRIKAKRARYAAEAVAESVADPQAARRFADKTARVQEMLGVGQDATVACEVVDSIARDHGDSTDFVLASGRLIERHSDLAQRARRRWKEVWNDLDRKKTTSWLKV